MPHLTFVLPVFNEEKNLIGLLRRISDFSRSLKGRYQCRIVAVDDGSNDNSLKILRQANLQIKVEILVHRFNRGLGETLRDGLELAADLSTAYDVIITMDSDDTHDPDTVHEMLAAIDKGSDVVIASRFLPGANVTGLSPWRHFLSAGARVVTTSLFRIVNVKDYSCGFRAIRASTLKAALQKFEGRFIETLALGFVCTVEVLWKLSVAGANCSEVPFHLCYERKKGASKMRVWKTILGYLKLIMIIFSWRATKMATSTEQSVDSRKRVA